MSRPKRKRATAHAQSLESESDKENGELSRPKTKVAKPSTKATPKTTTTSAKKPSSNSNAKEAKKLYTDTLKAIDKRTAELDRKVKAMDPNSWSLTTSDYAIAARKHLPTVQKLEAMDPVLAFNLLLSMGDASHTDLDASMKMCGEPGDESGPTFEKLDAALLPLIEARAAPTEHVDVLPEVPHRWTRADADVEPFKTGNGPNKQQRNMMYAQKLEWEKERRDARRARWEECEDWVKVVLSDLTEDRDYLAEYGVEGYLPKSIGMLEGSVGART